MKRILLFALLLPSAICFSRTSDMQESRITMPAVSAPAIGQNTTLIGTGIQYHQLIWNVQGNVASCTVALDSSADGNSWNAGGAIAGQACTSNGTSAIITGVFNNVRPNVTSVSGGGMVTIVYMGWTGPLALQPPVSSNNNSIPTFNSANGLQDPNGCTIVSSNLACTGSVKGSSIQTASNCAANSVSPAACGSAPSGVFVIPTLTTSYTVNSTAVTANSRIFLQSTTDNTGIPSSPACAALALTALSTVSARSAGTSFTFTLPSTIGTTCFNFWIVN